MNEINLVKAVAIVMLAAQVSIASETVNEVIVPESGYVDVSQEYDDTEIGRELIGYGMIVGAELKMYNIHTVETLGKNEFEDEGQWPDKEMMTALVGGGTGWMFKTESGNHGIYPFTGNMFSGGVIEIIPIYGLLIES